MSRARAIITFASGRRAKWGVVVFWLLIVALAGPLSGKLTGAEKNDSSSWLPAKAESTQVLDLQSKIQSPNVFTAVVVYDRPSGLTSADKAKAAADRARFATVAGVVSGKVTGPIVSQDGKAIETLVPVNLGSQGWNKASDAATSLRNIARDGPAGLSVHIAGPLGSAADSANSFKGIDGTLLIATLAVVIVLLLITYRSPTLWLFPVISAGIALVSAEALIYLLARAGLTVNAQSAGILYVLVFGAGTDYALLLTARYREELRRHEDRHEAMALAMRRAGPAIIASAGTVILSLLTLSFAELNSTKSLGPVLAIGVAVALLSMMTLLPALLLIFGRRIFWPVKPAFGSAEPTTRGFWAGVGRRIAVRPRVVWIVTALVLGVMALGLTGLRASGLTAAESFVGHHPESVVGQTIISEHFPAGAGQPVVVVSNPAQAAQVETAFKGTPGITGVTGPVTRGGHAFLEGTLTSAPDSQAAYGTIDKVRDAVHAVPGADAMVGGNTAITLDIARAADHDRNVIILIILVLVFVILGLLLRAIIAPIMLIATVALSFGAALGVSSLFFNHVFSYGNADNSFPLFVFVFLVALGIDYNIFLMTRVREEAQRVGPRRGALIGLSATGGVITSAGLVLAGTFAALGTLPVTFLAELGFAVAFGVLLDTLVVRSVLVTSLNLDLGRWVWWPSRLYRESVPEQPEHREEEPAAVP
ncbi:MAG TPA: MMPL family transporter [Streptosporangiaceae bacterium]|nr:MMPL family transporter [Streptosporangiaceae bacterium]